jgi:hypothetical protein
MEKIIKSFKLDHHKTVSLSQYGNKLLLVNLMKKDAVIQESNPKKDAMFGILIVFFRKFLTLMIPNLNFSKKNC